jgi:hypothetical protein
MFQIIFVVYNSVRPSSMCATVRDAFLMTNECWILRNHSEDYKEQYFLGGLHDVMHHKIVLSAK